MVKSVHGSDEESFVRLTAPHRRALHLHCYRMLGSLHDADDATQETMLRAWRAIERFEPRASLSSWLHRIATNVCLRMLEQRSRRTSHEIGRHLQPYPDRLLEDLPAGQPGPDVQVEEREAIGLAFVAALQFLPPKQRAVLVLRDVLGWRRARPPSGSTTASRRSIAPFNAPATGCCASARRARSPASTHRPARPSKPN